MQRFLKRAFFCTISFVVLLELTGCGHRTDIQESVVAGGPNRFMEVRHIVICGSNEEIGREIGKIARKNGSQIVPSEDVKLNKMKRIYIEIHYPLYYERMKGMATAFGLDIEDDRYDLTSLRQNTFGLPGCSVVFYPDDATETGHGILSRNYDFTTGTVQGMVPGENEIPVMSRPFIFELYPDEGYASISITAFDYLGGTIDGINSEGLTVAVLADGESPQLVGYHPTNEEGVHELMGMRYLLDNCSNTDEAEEALLDLKHYYSFTPCHYIVADRDGKSFIFEISPDRQSFHISKESGPQCITNHLVYKHPDPENLPEGGSFSRYRLLSDRLSEKERFSLGEIRAINKEVAVPFYRPGDSEYAPGRTLWYATYDTEELSLKVSFYMGETPDPEDESKCILDYTEDLEFKLDPQPK